MKNVIYLSLVASVGLATLAGCGKTTNPTLTSPDGTIAVEVSAKAGKLYYTVDQGRQPVLNDSRLGLVLGEGDLADGLRITNVEHTSFDQTWEQPWGEERTVRNHYNEMSVTVEQQDSGRTFAVVFRVFDDGIGFRYEFPQQEALGKFVVMDELTEFALAGNHTAWSIPAETQYYEALYASGPAGSLATAVSTPLTMQTADGHYLSIHEAALTDYPALNLVAPQVGTPTLKADPTRWSTGEVAFMEAPRTTPWRTLIVAGSPGGLILSRLMLNLNEPSQIEDTSWIEPGRYIGVWWGMHTERYTWYQGPKHGATTENVKRYIDFAAAHNFAGVLVEGWNDGWQNDWTVEGDKFSFTRTYSDFDLEEITRYAARKNVKLIGHHETGGATKNYEAQIEDAFALYQKYGVDVVKTGYVSPLLDGKERHSSQYGVRHYRKVIETAARYHIMIDNHEPVMPSGLQRTWPNLMTQEGVRGQEWDAWSTDGGNPPEHTTVIPFTRGLAGPMDFTPGTFYFTNPVHPGTRVQTTVAKQLALSVILYSPLQMASDEIENYEGNPAFEFITRCPTNWETTSVPEAVIGSHVVIARRDRDSDEWFVGAITNAEARAVSLPLDFLETGVSYNARIFCDGPGADYRTDPYPVEIIDTQVDSTSTLDLNLAPGGGSAIILTKL